MKSAVDGSLSSINNDGASTSRIIKDEDVQMLVEKFCYNLSRLEFDSAQQNIETDKLVNSSLPHNSDKIWQQMIGTISQLASADREYFSLSFFIVKFSFTKNNHSSKDQYSKIRQDLRRIDNNADSPFSHPEIAKNSLRKVIVEYFCNYAATRMDMIDFYLNLQGKDWRCVVPDSLAKLNAIYDVYKRDPPTPLSPQPDLIVRELEILLKAYNLMKLLSECKMLDSLLLMKELRQSLTEFIKEVSPGITSKNTNSGLFGFMKTNKSITKCYLLSWFITLYNTILFKFSLYFNDVLGNYMTPYDLKQFQSINTSMNMYNYFSTYMRKQGPNCIAIVMCRGTDQTPFYGFGYHRFLRNFDTAKPSKDEFPVLMSMMNGNQKNYESMKPRIDQFLKRFHQVAHSEGKPAYLSEKEKDLETTYFCAHIEWKLFLIITFEKKVVEKDNSVMTFLSDVIGFLRFTKLYQELKTPSKSREG